MGEDGSAWRRTVPAAAAAAVVTIMLAACASPSGSTGTSSSPDPTASASASAAVSPTASPRSGVLAGTAWLLASYTPAGGTGIKADPSSVAALGFGQSGELTGSTGCNRFGGSYEESSANLTFTLGPMTKAACTSARLAAQEKAVTAGLAAARSFIASAATLTLVDASGVPLLAYRVAATSLVGPTWTATGINNGKGGVETTATTSKATAVFEDKGNISGSTGCNSYFGPYKTSGTKGLTIGPLSSTLMACIGAAGDTEAHYLAALEKVVAYRIDADGLTLVDAHGATQVHYVAG